MDPLAEKYAFQSPYAYAINNPILFRDILGLGVTDWFERDGDIIWNDSEESTIDINGETWKNVGKELSFTDENGIQTNYHSDQTFDNFYTGATVLANRNEGTSKAYTRSIGVSGALFGGFGMEIGYAQDSWSNWGIFIRFSGEIGIGGGVTLPSIQEITPTEGTISLSIMGGKDLEYNLDIGPVGLLYGGDQGDQRPQGLEKFTKFGDYYTIGGFTVSNGVKKFKAKPKLSLGARASFGETFFLYKKRE